MKLWNETKSIPISRSMIWEAYKKVRANKGSAGVDEVSMDEYDADRRKHLYKLWNRMASGSYFPPCYQQTNMLHFRKIGMYQNRKIAMHDSMSKVG